jgi:hypothetical protein
MPKRTSTKDKTKRPTDINQLAFLLVKESTEEKAVESQPVTRKPVPKAVSRVMAQMGSRGGKIGGKRRLATMTPEQRSQVASDAARARWAKKKDTSA